MSGMTGSEGADLSAWVSQGASFIEILDRLRSSPDTPFSPLSVLRIVQEQLGIPFTETRNLYEYFDPDLRPLVEESIIEERWRAILAAHGRSTRS